MSPHGVHRLPVKPIVQSRRFYKFVPQCVSGRITVKYWARDLVTVNEKSLLEEVSNTEVDVQEMANKRAEVNVRVENSREKGKLGDRRHKKKKKKKRKHHEVQSAQLKHLKHHKSKRHGGMQIIPIPGGPDFEVPLGRTHHHVIHNGWRYSLYLDRETGWLQKFTKKQLGRCRDKSDGYLAVLTKDDSE